MAEQTSSPIGSRLGQRLLSLVRGGETIVATDIGLAGLASVEPERTSAGDSATLKRMHRAQHFARSLFNDEFDASRLGGYRDYREMRDEVPELGRSIDVLRDFVFGGDPSDPKDESLRIVFGDGARPIVQDVGLEAFFAIGGQPWAEGVFDEGITLGDSPSEMVFTTNRLVGSKPIRPDRFAVNWDMWGRLQPYTVRATDGLDGERVYLAPWQVVHYAPDRLRSHRYGRSMLITARKRWRGAQVAEDVLGVLLILKAAARKSMTYQVGSSDTQEQIDEALEGISQGMESRQFFDGSGNLRRRVATILALDDAIVPYRQGREKPEFFTEPAADLKQIIEVLRWYQESYFIATGVPAALAGMERNINAKATLEQQALHFIRIVKRRQKDVARFVLQALLLGLGAAGIAPTAGEISVEMAPSSQFNEMLRAQILKLRAEAAKILGVDIGLDPLFVLVHALGLDEATATEALVVTGADDQEGAAEARLRLRQHPRQDMARDLGEALRRHPELAAEFGKLRQALVDHLAPARASAGGADDLPDPTEPDA